MNAPMLARRNRADQAMTKKIIIATAMVCVVVWIVLLVRMLAGMLLAG
jgi:hypothetical protein